MTENTWEDLTAMDLAQHHVGQLVRIDWSHRHTVTGRLATLEFSHKNEEYMDGSWKLGDRTCRVTLEVGVANLNLDLKLNAKVAVEPR